MISWPLCEYLSLFLFGFWLSERPFLVKGKSKNRPRVCRGVAFEARGQCMRFCGGDVLNGSVFLCLVEVLLALVCSFSMV